MANNLGKIDRILRIVAGTGMLACAAWAPLDPSLRLWALALPAVYVLGTAVLGSCLGYKLLGLSSCVVSSRRLEAER